MSAEAKILRIAERQHNLFTLRQALGAGLTDHQIRSRVRRRLLVRVHAGVFRTAGVAPTPEQRALAACLACGEGAFASSMTAAALWGLVGAEPGQVEVTVPLSRRPRVPGVTVHRSGVLGPRERTVLRRVPVSTVPRTLLDVAGVLSSLDLELATDEALRRRVTTPHRLLTYSRRPVFDRRPGIDRLRALAADRLGKGVPESDTETRLLDLIRTYGLPEPSRQYEVVASGRRVRFDLAFPEQRVGIELDGWAPHWGRDRWQSDHDRHNATELAGWRTFRFTWWDVTERPMFVAMTVGEALGIRPVRWTPLPPAVRP